MSSSKRISLGLLAGVFLVSGGILAAVYLSFPELEESERSKMTLPRNVDAAKELGLVLSKYRRDHGPAVFAGILVVYVFLQSFAIPGSIFLSILSGYLFAFPLALGLVCTCSAVGATLCYALSSLLGRGLVSRWWPERVDQWSQQVAKHRDHLLNYIIFLRITPFLPNWFINIAAPIIQVPLGPFFLGTFVGVAPPSIFFIQAGTTLEQMTKDSTTFNWGSLGILGLCALLSLAPVAFRTRLRAKLE